MDVHRLEGRLVARAGIEWLEPVSLLGGCARVLFTTRRRGSGRPPFDAGNLAYNVGDVEERVRQNRLALVGALPRRLLEPVVGEQTHGACVAPVGRLHAGCRWSRPERMLSETDGLVTGTPFLPLVILVADCIPVALVARSSRRLAAVHAGRRGLANGILTRAVDVIQGGSAGDTSELVAWIGPGIGRCCYQVGPDVAARFPAETVDEVDGALHLDLPHAARLQLRAAGVPEENIVESALCTVCREDLFFSHRAAVRSGRQSTGRQALVAWLEQGTRAG